MKRLSISLFLSLSLPLFACGTKDQPAGTPSASPTATAPAAAKLFACKADKLAVCTEYTGASGSIGETHLRGMCEIMEGTFASTPCPTEKSLGTCDMGKGQIKTYYPGGVMENTAADAKDDCIQVSEGKWTPVAAK
jgi:hypothetical protein